jgi:hypothetical protein
MKNIITENPLHRIKLMMNYELGKTLNENKQNILEQSACANSISYDEFIAYVNSCEEAIDSLQNWRGTQSLFGMSDDARRVYDSIAAVNNKNVYDETDGSCVPAIPLFMDKYKQKDSDDWGWGSQPLKKEIAALIVDDISEESTRFFKKSLQILNAATKKGQEQVKPVDNGFPKCAQAKGKVVNGMITYQSVVWDKPSVSLLPNGTYLINSGKYKGKTGKYSCTQTGKVYLDLPNTKSPDDGDGVKKGGDGKKSTKSKYYDCSSVNIETTPLTYGCKDQKISQIQACLGIASDGKFGPNTRKALIDNAYDVSKGITKEIYDKVMAGCKSGNNTQTASSTEGGADVNYLKNPIKLDLGKVPEMPKNTQGMSDAKYYQSLVDKGLIQKNLAGRVVYNGPVLEPEEKIKLDNQASALGYTPTQKVSATDGGARYVWKRK